MALRNERDKADIHTGRRDYLFPQMMMDPELRRQMDEDRWSPGFIDYLFLAFNTSTAFSPTDVPGALTMGESDDDRPGR